MGKRGRVYKKGTECAICCCDGGGGLCVEQLMKLGWYKMNSVLKLIIEKNVRFGGWE